MTRRRTTSDGIEAWHAAPALHGEEDLRQSGSRGVRRRRGEPPGLGEARRGVPLRELWRDSRWPPAEVRTRVAGARRGPLWGAAAMSMALHVHERWVSVKSRQCIDPGEIFYDPEMRLTTARDDREFVQRIATLTLREHEMLRLRAQGLTNPEIADRCYLSEQTVKNHLHKAVRKLVLDGIDERAKLNRALYLLGRFEGRDTGG